MHAKYVQHHSTKECAPKRNDPRHGQQESFDPSKLDKANDSMAVVLSYEVSQQVVCT
eukprot:m.31738 g.31738  ORF g.31738 m.31738 type:complete len:57 (-) comp9456_c0_seq2:53-223(-)